MKKIKITDIEITSDQLPYVLQDLDLFPLLTKRLIERLNCSNIRPSDEEQYQNLQLFLSREKIYSDSDLNKWLEINNISEKELSLKLYKLLQVEKFKRNKFESKVESIFMSRKDNLDKVMYSLFRTKEKAKAIEIHLKIEEEEGTFADLASDFSEGIERQINGLIGPIEIGRINIQIAERLKISKKGQLWDPFQVDDWWVLLRLEKLLPAKLDERTRNSIIQDLYDEWINGQVKESMNSLIIDNCDPNSSSGESALDATSNSLELSSHSTSQTKPDSSILESFINKLPFRRG